MAYYDVKAMINCLKMENELMLFNTITGESIEYDDLEGINQDCFRIHEEIIRFLERFVDEDND